EGLAGMAKSLVGSSWVEGSATLLAKLVLKGKAGQNEQGGTWLMPPAEFLSDRHLAAILTYIRRRWGNLAEPVAVDVVAGARQERADRAPPRHTAELDQLNASRAPRRSRGSSRYSSA